MLLCHDSNDMIPMIRFPSGARCQVPGGEEAKGGSGEAQTRLGLGESKKGQTCAQLKTKPPSNSRT